VNCGTPLQFLDEPRRGTCGVCFHAGVTRWHELLGLAAVAPKTGIAWPADWRLSYE
jgi:hypothetical protein